MTSASNLPIRTSSRRGGRGRPLKMSNVSPQQKVEHWRLKQHANNHEESIDEIVDKNPDEYSDSNDNSSTSEYGDFMDDSSYSSNDDSFDDASPQNIQNQSNDRSSKDRQKIDTIASQNGCANTEDTTLPHMVGRIGSTRLLRRRNKRNHVQGDMESKSDKNEESQTKIGPVRTRGRPRGSKSAQGTKHLNQDVHERKSNHSQVSNRGKRSVGRPRKYVTGTPKHVGSRSGRFSIDSDNDFEEEFIDTSETDVSEDKLQDALTVENAIQNCVIEMEVNSPGKNNVKKLHKKVNKYDLEMRNIENDFITSGKVNKATLNSYLKKRPRKLIDGLLNDFSKSSKKDYNAMEDLKASEAKITYDRNYLDERYHQFSPFITYHLPILTHSPPQLHVNYFLVWNDYLEYRRRIEEGLVDRDILKNKIKFWDGIHSSRKELNNVSEGDQVWLVHLEKIIFRLEKLQEDVPLTIATLHLRVDHSLSQESPQRNDGKDIITLDYVDFTWLPQFLFTAEHLNIALEYFQLLQPGMVIHAAFNGEDWQQGTIVSLIKNENTYTTNRIRSDWNHSELHTSKIRLQDLPVTQQLRIVQSHIRNIEVKWENHKRKVTDRTTINPQNIGRISCWELNELVHVKNWESRMTNDQQNFDNDLRIYFSESLYGFANGKSHNNLQYLNYKYPYPIATLLIYERLAKRYYRNVDAFLLDLVHLYECLREDSRLGRLNPTGKSAVKTLEGLMLDFTQIIQERNIDRILYPLNPAQILKTKRIDFTLLIPETIDLDLLTFTSSKVPLQKKNYSGCPSECEADIRQNIYFKIESVAHMNSFDIIMDSSRNNEKLELQPIEFKTLHLCKWMPNESCSMDEPTIVHPNKDSLVQGSILVKMTPKQRNGLKLLRSVVQNAALDDEKYENSDAILKNYQFLVDESLQWSQGGFYYNTGRTVLNSNRFKVVCEMIQICAVKDTFRLEIMNPNAQIVVNI